MLSQIWNFANSGNGIWIKAEEINERKFFNTELLNSISRKYYLQENKFAFDYLNNHAVNILVIVSFLT